MSRSSVEWYKQGQILAKQHAGSNFAPMISLPQPATLINGVYTTVVQPHGGPPPPPQPFKPIPLTGYYLRSVLSHSYHSINYLSKLIIILFVLQAMMMIMRILHNGQTFFQCMVHHLITI